MSKEPEQVFAEGSKVTWPEGKDFAFTVFDDTDLATLANVGPVYSFLHNQGFRTTKSCWLVNGDPAKGRYQGQTCDDADYMRWLLELQSQGFEIGWHGGTWHGLPREAIRAALDRFSELFGCHPLTATNHSEGESIYWGNARLSGSRAILYDIFTRFRNKDMYQGHLEGNDYFWGDMCKEKIKYFRNFVFSDINTLKSCPFMPYHDPLKPLVKYWFASSNGNRVPRFVRCISEKNQDRLEAEGGACIMYTHFACGFTEDKRLHPRFQSLMTRLSKKNGWFVPVGKLLDHLLATQGHHEIIDSQRRHLEWKWLKQKLLIGTD